jgi:hypothetical protein
MTNRKCLALRRIGLLVRYYSANERCSTEGVAFPTRGNCKMASPDGRLRVYLEARCTATSLASLQFATCSKSSPVMVPFFKSKAAQARRAAHITLLSSKS